MDRELDEISIIGTRLENEAKMLEYFPKVRATMQAIKSAQEKADQEAEDARRTVDAQENLLNAAKETAEKAKEAEQKAKEIQEQIDELQSDLDEAKSKGRKSKVIEGLEEEITEREEEMAALGTPEDWKKAKNAVGKRQQALTKAVTDLNNKKANKEQLTHPWDTILKGKLWTEIGDMESKDISDLVKTKVEKPEAKWAENPTPKDDKDKDKDKGQNTGRGVNQNTSDVPPAPQQPDSSEQGDDGEHDEEDPFEHDEEEEEPPIPDDDSLEHDEEPDSPVPDLPKTWSEKHKVITKFLPKLAKWMDKRIAKKSEETMTRLSEEERALKSAKGERIRAESSINKVDLQIKNYEINARMKIMDVIETFDKHNPDFRTAKEKLPKRSLEQIKSVAAMYIARGDYTEEEMYEILKDRAHAEKRKEEDTYILTADSSYNEIVRNMLSKQLPYLTVNQLEERKPYLEMLGVYTEEEFKDIQEKVETREKSEKEALNAELERARRGLIQTREAEAEAERAYKETQVSASRQAHRDFASELNGGATIPTPEVEYVEAEMVREGDYAIARAAIEAELEDQFVEEPADTDDGSR